MIYCSVERGITLYTNSSVLGKQKSLFCGKISESDTCLQLCFAVKRPCRNLILKKSSR